MDSKPNVNCRAPKREGSTYGEKHHENSTQTIPTQPNDAKQMGEEPNQTTASS